MLQQVITRANIAPEVCRRMASLGRNELIINVNLRQLTRSSWDCLMTYIMVGIEKCLTHWGWVTHICVDNLTIIGSDNGLSPGRRQDIIRTNARILLTGPLGINFSDISIEMLTFSFAKMHLKVSTVNYQSRTYMTPEPKHHSECRYPGICRCSTIGRHNVECTIGHGSFLFYLAPIDWLHCWIYFRRSTDVIWYDRRDIAKSRHTSSVKYHILCNNWTVCSSPRHQRWVIMAKHSDPVCWL